MNETELGDILHAESIRPVRPGPGLDPVVVRASAARHVRRRRALVSTTVAAVAVLVVSGLALATRPDPSPPVAPAITPTGSQRPTSTPSGSPSPSFALGSVGWGDRTYPVRCGTVPSPIRVTGGKATVDGFHISVYHAEYALATRRADAAHLTPVEVVTVYCFGADTFPDSVLVYSAGASGPVLRGVPVSYGQNTEVTSIDVSDGILRITAEGWSSTAPHYQPDLTVTTTVTLTPTGLDVHRHQAPRAPSPQVNLVRTSPAGARDVTVTATVTGTVPQEWSPQDNQFLQLATGSTRFTRINWGDGTTPGGSDGGIVSCRAGAPLVTLQETFHESHTYAAPGSYTVTFVTATCPQGQSGGAGTGPGAVTGGMLTRALLVTVA